MELGSGRLGGDLGVVEYECLYEACVRFAVRKSIASTVLQLADKIRVVGKRCWLRY